ncbi:GntT/GntP/DsdX family permease, partial [Staphylococcus epidermidis]|uniref:GntT/GntP/DsdX family permease n=1 Tax=Staphylococcus epidermidis TaxID=1282 RepID=UPI003F68980A
MTLFTPILPLILIFISTILQLITPHQQPTNLFEQILYFIPTPPTPILIPLIFPIFTIPINQQQKIQHIM